MRRRDFLTAAAGSVLLPQLLPAGEIPRDIKITRIVGFDLITRRSKLAGKNSHLGVHGDQSRDRMVRIFTNANVEGLGNCRAGEQALAGLLGKNPFHGFDTARRPFTGGLGRQTMPMWDLAGKVLNKPVYELLGVPSVGHLGCPTEWAGPQRVPVYDGSIYFADLLPQYAPRWQDRFKEEIDLGVKAGHRAFKVKIGRGYKWMERSAGDNRDVEVVQLIRKHGGKDLVIGVDANDGYDLPGTKRFLDRAGDLNLAFLEEMFPEKIEECLELKSFLADHGWETLLADGESQRHLEVFKPYIRAKAMDVLQADMNLFGFEDILTEAAWARPQGILLAPHNWGSLIGFYMQLHVGRAITNFYLAEKDPLSSELLIADGYEIRDGTCSVPDAPGFGLRINEERFRDMKVNFDLKG